MEQFDKIITALCLKINPENLADCLMGHRKLTMRIRGKKELYHMVCAQNENFGGSIIKRRNGEKEELLLKISREDELEAEIQALEEEERLSYQQLRSLSDMLKSENQRLVIEAYYYQAFCWGEVAMLMHRKDTPKTRRNCQTTRCNAVAAMKRLLLSVGTEAA